MNEFFSMSGYAGYVWSCFGISFVVMLALWLEARRTLVKTRVRLTRRLSQEVES
ncbi:MAG: heme exporter protein CcmD [Pseudomonadota bacterium]